MDAGRQITILHLSLLSSTPLLPSAPKISTFFFFFALPPSLSLFFNLLLCYPSGIFFRERQKANTKEPAEKGKQASRQTHPEDRGVTYRQTERTRISAVPPKTNKPNNLFFYYASLHIETSPSLGAYDPQEGIHPASNRQIDSLLHLTFDESRSTYTCTSRTPALRTVIKQHLTIFISSLTPPGNPIEVRAGLLNPTLQLR
ncbi:uncharacterized protein ARB_04287 [Trichophyton benhamiae CBS 112371]|uniref:Uncharacterized protein n=1 Tax=Arthroderma benhamiae (strain ATCC MYA-4681 / CBS 112371) TaxID=663331 RepID=D4AJ39_ARTBC|nr:uncharacterized protein ARB_04287 [Trichophyton benhamiae CBS 112371]EFE36762.1 hypothetical protein ARB_04287 [Trichophyton benhamiae CBS 112371]